MLCHHRNIYCIEVLKSRMEIRSNITHSVSVLRNCITVDLSIGEVKITKLVIIISCSCISPQDHNTHYDTGAMNGSRLNQRDELCYCYSITIRIILLNTQFYFARLDHFQKLIAPRKMFVLESYWELFDKKRTGDSGNPPPERLQSTSPNSH